MFALVENDLTVNVIELDDPQSWTLDPGQELIDLTNEPEPIQIGSLRNGDGSWTHPAPASPLPVVYPSLTPRQLRLMLLNIGITEAQVDAEIDAIADPVERDASRIEWKYASTYERDHPLIDQMATAFSLPPEQVDTLWLAAADL
ncbi:hypothetical protein [Stappia sp.]|uniref:hypothetical protein n=1 Tax=Stappia sp. TaxID=1870903 RepID=UPI003C79ADC6